MPRSGIVEHLGPGTCFCHRGDNGVDTLLLPPGIIQGVVDLGRDALRPCRPYHGRIEGTRRHDDTTDPGSAAGYMLCHTSTVGKAHGDETIAEIDRGGECLAHQGWEANFVNIFGGRGVVVEDPSLILVYDHHIVISGTQPVGGIGDARADT